MGGCKDVQFQRRPRRHLEWFRFCLPIPINEVATFGGIIASTLIIGADNVTAPWIEALRGAGHGVEHCADVLSFQERFSGTPVDVLAIDIANADHGEAMLMAQARSVWRDCRVIAMPRDRSYRSSAIFSMGLWAPDRLLMQPVPADVLVQSVDQLQCQARVDRLIRDRRVSRDAGLSDQSVIIQCNDARGANWSVKTH